MARELGMISAYGAACLFLGFMLALYLVGRLLDWLPALARAHRRGLERVAFYDEARRQAAIAVAIRRHPAGYLPKTAKQRRAEPYARAVGEGVISLERFRVGDWRVPVRR